MMNGGKKNVCEEKLARKIIITGTGA